MNKYGKRNNSVLLNESMERARLNSYLVKSLELRRGHSLTADKIEMETERMRLELKSTQDSFSAFAGTVI